MEMSINRALAELKLLNKKITDKTNALLVAEAAKGVAAEAKQVFIRDQAASIQQVRDFIVRRNAIKSAIVASNAKTTVTIGNKTMTVAEAIERKTGIEHEKHLMRRLRERYYGAKAAVEKHNETVKAMAEKQAATALGAQKEGDKSVEYKAVFDVHYNMNKAELVAQDGFEKEIETGDDAIAEFEKDVDFILSESNTRTMINV